MDGPTQVLLQQMRAHPHSGEHLEVLGKKAAADWTAGQHKTLTAAVTATVKEAQLSPEQVRRVVEFANTDAYLAAFRKEGSTHRVVDFPGGPADTADILRDLNDGVGGSVFDRGTGDYDSPPAGAKTASAGEEEALADLFDVKVGGELPFADPHAEAYALKDKIAGVCSHMQSEIGGLEVMYADLADRTYYQTKQAALEGVTLGEVLQAWQTVAPSDDHIKVAFTLFTPRLLRDGVFYGIEQMTASVDKTAGARMVNPEHPLVVEFGEFCTVLSKLAELRAARAELRGHELHLHNYLKSASLAGDAYRAATRASTGAGEAIAPFVEKGLGSGAASVAKGLVTHAPNIALGVGAMEAATHLQHSPHPAARAARGVHNLLMRNIPGTDERLRHLYEVESGQ